MFEVEAQTLESGDEFTADNGETWLKARRVSVIQKANRVVVVCEGSSKDYFFKLDQLVIVK